MHRAYRLSRLHWDAHLAAALESALLASAPPRRPRRGLHPQAGQARGPSELCRSFVGALACLPDARAAQLLSLLQVFTFPRVLRAVAAPRYDPQRHLKALLGEWNAATSRCRAMDGLQLRRELLLELRRRLPGQGASPAPAPQLDTFLNELLRALAQEYVQVAGAAGPELLQNVLCAAAQEVGSGSPADRMALLARRSLVAMASRGAGLAALCAVGHLGRRRIALTLTTLLYVLVTGLSGVTLAFDVYRWIALVVDLMAEPPALLTYLAAGGSAVFNRQKRKFDLRLAAAVLLALYLGMAAPPAA